LKIKGGALAARASFVNEHFGSGAWESVVQALPAEMRSGLGMILPSSWFPFEVGKAVDAAIVDVLGKGDRQVFERIGAASADKNLGGSHRHFLAPGDPQGFLAKAPTVYGFYYDTGRREYQPTGPTSGVLTTYDAEAFSAADCLTVIGWHKRALEMCGARGVSMTEETCRASQGPYCRYVVRWESVEKA
jgi:hypothetical protein